MANFFGYPLIQVAMSLYGNGALASSGALSLGTTAGTDRSISGEFGGTTPHGLSEYYGVCESQLESDYDAVINRYNERNNK